MTTEEKATKSIRREGWLKAPMRYLLSLVVGLALVGLLVYLAGFENVVRWRALRFWPMLGAFLATIGIVGVTSVRWGHVADRLAGTHIAQWADYFHYFTVGRVLGFVLPKDLSDFVNRTIWLNQFHGLDLPRAGMSVLLDRIADVFCTFLFLLAIIPYWMGWLSPYASIGLMVIAAGLTGGILTAISGCLPLERIVKWVNGRLRSVKRWTKSTIGDSALSSEVPLTNIQLQILYWLSIGKFVLSTLRLLLFTVALGLPISPALIVLGMPLGQLSYLFAFTPGGLGIFEAGWFAVLSIGGISTQNAVYFVVGQRILTMALIGILAILSQVQYMVRQGLPRTP